MKSYFDRKEALFLTHVRGLKWAFMQVWLNGVIGTLPSHSLRLFLYRKSGMVLGVDSSIHRCTTFDAPGNFSLGRESTVNARCRIDNRAPIEIGSYVSISRGVTIITGDHDMQDPSFASRLRSVFIEDYAFLGTNALILPGVRIGRGAVVGAGSVIRRDVPALEIHAGNPAVKVGVRGGNLHYSTRFRPLFK